MLGRRIVCQVPETREWLCGHSTGVIMGKKIKCHTCCRELQQGNTQTIGQASDSKQPAGAAAAGGGGTGVGWKGGSKGGVSGGAGTGATGSAGDGGGFASPEVSSGSGSALKVVARSKDGCYTRSNFAWHAGNRAKRPAAAITLVDFPEFTLHVSTEQWEVWYEFKCIFA